MVLYKTDPTVHEAVNVMARLVTNPNDELGTPMTGANVIDELVHFFASWDRARTDQIADLERRLTAALMDSIAPPMIWPAGEDR